jgi:Putative rhamnosyl transferase
MSFTHILLTRFNVEAGYGAPNLRLDPKWLEYRFQLFDRFCYPSVCAQSNQNFKWLVFFDIQTPESFKPRIERYAQWKKFIPVYVHGYFSDSVLGTAIANHIERESSHLITTRLDNDDAITQNFVELIQLEFRTQDCEFINFTQGYCLHNHKLYQVEDRSNAFISLIEFLSSSTPKTVLCVAHNKLDTIGKIRQIAHEVGWLQVIHHGNVSNIVRGNRQPLEFLGNHFAVSREAIMQKPKNLSSIQDEVFYLLRVGRKILQKLASFAKA